MLHRATGPKTVIFESPNCRAHEKNTKPCSFLLVTVFFSCARFFFSPVNYTLKILKNRLLNGLLPPHTIGSHITPTVPRPKISKTENRRTIEEVRMQESGFKSYDELPLFLNAKTVQRCWACHRPVLSSSCTSRTFQCCG